MIKGRFGEATFERKLAVNFPELKRCESLDGKCVSSFKWLE